jgi:putative DNA primase/helicase
MPFPSVGWSVALSEYQKAELAGRRFVTASEVSRRGELNEELIKSLTGGDTLNARHPYGRPFDFKPVAKFLLRVNDKPIIRDQSHGMWRRVKLVPFQQTFKVNTTLADELRAEARGILAWAVRGAVEWYRDGLRHPGVVEAETRAYQAESDPLAEFIAERCLLEADGEVSASVLFSEYVRWCNSRQLRDADRLSQRTLGQRMRARFEYQERRHVVYLGIRLRWPEENQVGEYHYRLEDEC